MSHNQTPLDTEKLKHQLFNGCRYQSYTSSLRLHRSPGSRHAIKPDGCCSMDCGNKLSWATKAFEEKRRFTSIDNSFSATTDPSSVKRKSNQWERSRFCQSLNVWLIPMGLRWLMDASCSWLLTLQWYRYYHNQSNSEGYSNSQNLKVWPETTQKFISVNFEVPKLKEMHQESRIPNIYRLFKSWVNFPHRMILAVFLKCDHETFEQKSDATGWFPFDQTVHSSPSEISKERRR